MVKYIQSIDTGNKYYQSDIQSIPDCKNCIYNNKLKCKLDKSKTEDTKIGNHCKYKK